jgi:hypothetical protein
MEVVNLENLPENFKVILDRSFRSDLFKKAVKEKGGFLKLSFFLGVDWSSLTKIRRGYRILKNKKSPAFLRVSLLKKLLQITKIPIKEAEENIIGIATNKKVAGCKLPIYSSEKLASLIGNTMGDGFVNKERFKYVNKRKELVEKVKRNVESIFKIDGREFFIEEKECYGIEFPGVIGQLLTLAGAPNGRKTSLNFCIPGWIKNGEKKVKIAFIRSLFDDEGSVCLCRSSYPFISISLYKKNTLIDNLLKFLNDLRKILSELGLKPSKVNYKKDVNDTKEFGFRLYGLRNLLYFYQKINFDSLEKRRKLKRAIEKYISKKR